MKYLNQVTCGDCGAQRLGEETHRVLNVLLEHGPTCPRHPDNRKPSFIQGGRPVPRWSREALGGELAAAALQRELVDEPEAQAHPMGFRTWQS